MQFEGAALLRNMLSRPMRKATLLLLGSTLLACTWRQFGSAEFFSEAIAPRWPAAGADWAPGVYTLAMAFVLLGCVPAVLVRVVLRERLADYGLAWGHWRFGLLAAVVATPLLLLIAYLAAASAAFQAVYPINRAAGQSAGHFALHIATLGLFYLGWEFHFRGFLQHGLVAGLGREQALLVQVLASTLAHLGKPGGELFGSVVAGLLWGAMTFRSRSILTSTLQHWIVGASLDGFVCLGR